MTKRTERERARGRSLTLSCRCGGSDFNRSLTRAFFCRTEHNDTAVADRRCICSKLVLLFNSPLLPVVGCVVGGVGVVRRVVVLRIVVGRLVVVDSVIP